MNGKQEQGRQRTLHRLPHWTFVPVFTIAVTTMILGMDLLQGKAVTWVDVAITLPITLVAAFIVLWGGKRIDARAAAKPAGWPTTDRFQSAVSTGRLPEEATAEQWLPKLRRAAAQERHMVWMGPLVFAAFSALGIYLVLDNPAHPWFGLLVSLACAAIAALCPLWSLRRRRKLQQLMAQFTQETSASQPA